MIETQKYVRKPLFVEAVRVTHNNFEEIAAWCQGEVLQDEAPASGARKKYIKVRVHNPKNVRQTKAFVGDWLLYTERGYKVYTNKAFQSAFDVAESFSDAVEKLRETGESVVTPPTILEVEEQDKAITNVETPVREWQDEKERIEYPETHIIGGTPREEINVEVPVEVVDGKRVLSVEAQEAMGSDQIRELIQSGEYVLVQDLAA